MAKSSPACLQQWLPDSGDSDLLDSARRLAEFAVTSQGLSDKARKELVNLALWWATEVDGKYTTRYRSRGVIELASTAPLPRAWWKALRHDHVTTRKSLAKRLLDDRENPAAVLAEAIGCTVTRDEHDRLNRVDDSVVGWARYASAGVEVLDMAERLPRQTRP